VEARAPLGELARTGDVQLWDVDFSSDGRSLAAAGWAGVFLVEPLLLSHDLDWWRRRLCGIVTRDLTELERRRYLRGKASRAACSGG
jgi:hypothetical protein